MPFTPFHMGPGILIKAFLQGNFSLMVFGWAQILMDIQPLIVLITGTGHLHGFSHTYAGAFLIAVVAILTGKYLSEVGLIILGVEKKDNPIKTMWWVAIMSAFIGTFSHVAIDSIMHGDIEPFYPLLIPNHLLGIITIKRLHEFYVYSGLIGACFYYFGQFLTKKHNKVLSLTR